jgi:hypothetical protein
VRGGIGGLFYWGGIILKIDDVLLRIDKKISEFREQYGEPKVIILSDDIDLLAISYLCAFPHKFPAIYTKKPDIVEVY